MIYHYGITQQGTYHVKNNLVCQDAHNFKRINDDFAIAAVADGLGSESHSDIASKTAVQESIDYCLNNLTGNEDKNKILDIIKESFLVSLNSINKIASEKGDNPDQYDTTLVVAVYLNGNVYYGNAGDSGIVILNEDGTYEKLTEQQRDEDGHVFPLCFGEEKWAFGSKDKVASVLMATDGIYETLFPFLLKGTDNPIYVTLAHYLMSEESLNFNKLQEKDVQQKLEQFISNIPDSQVNDDKTILVMVNSNITPKKLGDDYYKSPDWTELKKKRDEEYRKLAYPHLYDSNGSKPSLDKENTKGLGIWNADIKDVIKKVTNCKISNNKKEIKIKLLNWNLTIKKETDE